MKMEKKLTKEQIKLLADRIYDAIAGIDDFSDMADQYFEGDDPDINHDPEPFEREIQAVITKTIQEFSQEA